MIDYFLSRPILFWLLMAYIVLAIGVPTLWAWIAIKRRRDEGAMSSRFTLGDFRHITREFPDSTGLDFCVEGPGWHKHYSLARLMVLADPKRPPHADEKETGILILVKL